MHLLTPTTSDVTQSIDELVYFLQENTIDADFSGIYQLDNKYDIEQSTYILPSGKLRLANLIIYLPMMSEQSAIEIARKSAIKSALIWQKSCLQQENDNVTTLRCVFTLDIKLTNTFNTNSSHTQKPRSTSHSFGARYFMEELILDVSESISILQIFSAQDWQTLLATLKTPCDLWRFLDYHAEQLQQSLVNGEPSFDCEQTLLMQFMNSAAVFNTAIAVDNALVKYAMQDKPNSALVTMSLGQKNNSATAQMYQQHMQQAAIVWSQLSVQMVELATEKTTTKSQDIIRWQQQLLDESLFSRHELIRTLYRHPKQSLAMQQSGYVVHQHSYETLGRHYMLIFYGYADDAQQNKAMIRPNLQKIAQDVATRLPLVELNHVIVLGVDFVHDHDGTFIDIDLWIEPVVAMTQKERQLTKQLQSLSQENKKQPLITPKPEKKLPSLNLNLTIAARHKNS